VTKLVSGPGAVTTGPNDSAKLYDRFATEAVKTQMALRSACPKRGTGKIQENAWARENRKLAACATLPKNVTDFVDQPLVLEVRRFDLRQLFQNLSLFARQHRRSHD